MEYFMKNNFDVVFIQGADSTVFEKEPTRDFGWVKAGRSAIIYNKNKFGNEKTSLLEQYK
jgi:bacillopeptidase F (M6 metalloprotease family)